VLFDNDNNNYLEVINNNNNNNNNNNKNYCYDEFYLLLEFSWLMQYCITMLLHCIYCNFHR